TLAATGLFTARTPFADLPHREDARLADLVLLRLLASAALGPAGIAKPPLGVVNRQHVVLVGVELVDRQHAAAARAGRDEKDVLRPELRGMREHNLAAIGIERKSGTHVRR